MLYATAWLADMFSVLTVDWLFEGMGGESIFGISEFSDRLLFRFLCSKDSKGEEIQ